MSLQQEIQKRKTFAIISHPDAGKTTLTEKFLLFGGAIQVAGAVKSNKIKKHTSSDFMEIEKQRGISVSTSVMSFAYQGININLLDTPGHKDFAEDTYRTLSAVDSVILVIDCVKGVEEQTHKLMQVCLLRKIPVIIFINKLDRDGKDPYSLLEEIEQKLGIQTHPLTWPIGQGKDFKGVYNIQKKNILFFESHTKAEEQEMLALNSENEDKLIKKTSPLLYKQLQEDAMLLGELYSHFEAKNYLCGEFAPVFFGSAVNNFGIKEMLNTFIELAPSPQPRIINKQRTVQPEEETFSGFVFKIHANIDPRHRDRIAFVRICSGRFERGKNYHHVRLDKTIRFNNPYSFMARSKDVIDEAFPGDVVGIFDTGNFKIGDTITEGEQFYFSGIPTFSPEIFKELVNKDPMKSKQLEKGIRQLTDEGVAQLFTQFGGNKKIIGCVGELQFEVIQYRLLEEYGAACAFVQLPFYKACWIDSTKPNVIDAFVRFKDANIGKDKDNKWVYFANSEWFLNTEIENNPDIQFRYQSEIFAG